MSKLVEVVSRQPDLLTKQAIAYITGFATVRVPPTVRDLLLPSPNVAQRGHIEELCSGRRTILSGCSKNKGLHNMPQDIRSFFGGKGGQGPVSSQEKPDTKDVVRAVSFHCYF